MHNLKKSQYCMDTKVVLITGAAGILGRSFATIFAARGASLLLADLDQNAVEEMASQLSTKYGVTCLGRACDVSSPESVHDFIINGMEVFRRIDILINNAATKGDDIRSFFRPFEEYSSRVWREIMSVNLDGMFLMAQAVGRIMLNQSGGSIVQVSSIYGLLGPDPSIYEDSFYMGGEINTPAVYSASKAGIIGLTRHLATTWGRNGIRVNCVAPGGVSSGQNTAFSSKYSKRVPMGRMADANEIASAVFYLASDEASYITGQILAVDGGLTAW